MRLFQPTLAHFWSMFPFYTPWNGVFKGYKVGGLGRKGLKILNVVIS